MRSPRALPMQDPLRLLCKAERTNPSAQVNGEVDNARHTLRKRIDGREGGRR